MTTLNVGQDMEKLEFLCIVSWGVKIGKNLKIGAEHLRVTLQFHSKVNIQKVAGTSKTMCQTIRKTCSSPKLEITQNPSREQIDCNILNPENQGTSKSKHSYHCLKQYK